MADKKKQEPKPESEKVYAIYVGRSGPNMEDKPVAEANDRLQVIIETLLTKGYKPSDVLAFVTSVAAKYIEASTKELWVEKDGRLEITE